MRIAFQEQLDELSELGIRACRIAVDAVAAANSAVVTADLARADAATRSADNVAGLRAEAEQVALGLLAQQAPVATDLRGVLAALGIMSDAERMGALANHIGNAVRRRHPEPVAPVAVEPALTRMGELARHLAEEASGALTDRDAERARTLDETDDEMDDLQRDIFRSVMDPAWTAGVQAAVDVALLGRFYERFADHAVTVARRTVFLVTGESLQDVATP